MTAPTDTCVFHATVAAAWAHPVWSHYLVSVVHLREVEGAPAPEFIFLGASHELQIWALDPADNATILHPVNYAGQFTFDDDGQAARLGETIAAAILERKLNPDTDWLRRTAALIEIAAVQLGASKVMTSWRRQQAQRPT
jgi:hypothetical protein